MRPAARVFPSFIPRVRPFHSPPLHSPPTGFDDFFAPVATEVVLLHERFPDAGTRDVHEQGWTSILARLEALFD